MKAAGSAHRALRLPFRGVDEGKNVSDMNWDRVLETLQEIYGDVDRLAAQLMQRHAERFQCRRGCADCCVDGVTVFQVEAENIRCDFGGLLESAVPQPEGRCAFLDGAGGCRIYPHRPYVCRTQGLPLRWLEPLADGTVVQMRDICPINDTGAPIETLPESSCWEIGPVESRLAKLQATVDGGKMKRVPLRRLFNAASKTNKTDIDTKRRGR